MSIFFRLCTNVGDPASPIPKTAPCYSDLEKPKEMPVESQVSPATILARCYGKTPKKGYSAGCRVCESLFLRCMDLLSSCLSLQGSLHQLWDFQREQNLHGLLSHVHRFPHTPTMTPEKPNFCHSPYSAGAEQHETPATDRPSPEEKVNSVSPPKQCKKPRRNCLQGLPPEPEDVTSPLPPTEEMPRPQRSFPQKAESRQSDLPTSSRPTTSSPSYEAKRLRTLIALRHQCQPTAE